MLKKVDRGLMRISQISKFKCQSHNRLALNLREAIALLFQRISSVVSTLPSVISTKAGIQACFRDPSRLRLAEAESWNTIPFLVIPALSSVIPAKAGIQSVKFSAQSEISSVKFQTGFTPSEVSKRRLLSGFTPSDSAAIGKYFLSARELSGQNNFQLRARNQSGFTLIEVVVASAILVFLMASVWSASSIRESDFSVMISQEKLRLLATRAKSLTVNSVFRADNPACGYGIRVEQNRAFIFLDRGVCGSNDQRYTSNTNEALTGSTDIIILTGGMVFSPSIGTSVDVVFIPPYSGAAINGSTTAPTEVNIEVRSPLGISRRVIISNQGLISVRN